MYLIRLINFQGIRLKYQRHKYIQLENLHRFRTYNAEQHLKSTIIEYINEKSNNNQHRQSFYVHVINITPIYLKSSH
jgi:hypothetical protein